MTLAVTSTLDPRSRFQHMTHHCDMGKNQAKFHSNPTINSKVIIWKGVWKKQKNCDLDIQNKVTISGHDTPSSYEEQLCLVSSKSDLKH